MMLHQSCIFAIACLKIQIKSERIAYLMTFFSLATVPSINVFGKKHVVCFPTFPLFRVVDTALAGPRETRPYKLLSTLL